MMNNIKRIILTLILLLSLTGCIDGNNVNTSLFPFFLGFDYHNDEYVLSYLVIDAVNNNPVTNNKDTFHPLLIQGRGKSLDEAERNIDYYGNQKLLTSSLKAIIIHESLIHQDNKNLTNYFLSLVQNPLFNKEVNLFVISDSINDVFSLFTSINQVTYFSIINNYENATINNVVKAMNLINLTKTYLDDYQTTYLPLIKISQNKLSLNGVCFNLNQPLLKFSCINQELLKGYKWITNHKDFIYASTSENLTLNARVLNVATSFNKTNNQIEIDVKVNLAILTLLPEYDFALIASLFSDQIIKEIKTTYDSGLIHNLDIYNIKKHQREQHLAESLTSDLNLKVRVYISTKGLYQD